MGLIKVKFITEIAPLLRTSFLSPHFFFCSTGVLNSGHHAQEICALPLIYSHSPQFSLLATFLISVTQYLTKAIEGRVYFGS